MLSPFRMVCGNFILPEPASYVFFYAFSNLRNLLYIIKYFAGEGTISRYYENDNEDVILFEYVYMQHGSMSWISTEKADIISVSVNDLDGKLAVPKEEGINSTLVWFDPEKNLQFTIDAPLGENDILHIAESVSLVETTK